MKKSIMITVLLLSVASAAWAAEPAKIPDERELKLRYTLAQEMIARRQLEIQALGREAADLARQIQAIEKKKPAPQPAAKAK